MATLRPFAALRPPREKAARISSVPYDVVSTEEARRVVAGNPWSFLRVSRAEVELPEGTDPHADAVYEAARRRFESLRRDAPLVQEDGPSLYIYRIRLDGHVQTGIAATFSLDEYDAGTIRRHEGTRRDKEDDRTRHMLTLGAQTGTVFLTYRGRDGIDRIVSQETALDPLYEFASEDGMTHTLWRVSPASTAPLVKEFGSVPAVYIADGHHRIASAARAREELRRKNPVLRADAACHFFIAVAFPAEQVRILPYNRVVKDLGPRTPAQFLDALRRAVRVSDGASPQPPRGEAAMYLAGRWYGLVLNGVTPPPAGGWPADARAAHLDVARLQARVLDPVLGIRDIRTDHRIEFIGGVHGAAHLERLVDSGAAAVAFSMHPVALEDLMTVSDAGGLMPPKSTWFEPKLRDGLLVHLL